MTSGKYGASKVGTVFQPKPLIQRFRREYDAAVKFLHKCADFTHMPSAIGTAKKAAAFFQNTAYLRKDPAGLLAVEQDMIGDDEIKALVRIRNLMAVKGAEGKAGVGSSDASARIPKHAGRHIGECDGKRCRKFVAVFCPERTVAAANFKDQLPVLEFRTAQSDPWAPALRIRRKLMVQPYAGRNVGGIPVLAS